jgi:uncharacterized lipoprotein YddW (UPF0748 family)
MNRLLAVFLAAAGMIPAATATADDPPSAPREFRAVWVATVANIDWPSKPGLSPEQQRQEALVILDNARDLNLNAVIFQVRTAADALYDSRLEPWSAVLTGEQGKPPEPYYDPLSFWVEEAHRRGLQLHAWFNPFRARPAGAKYELAEGHVGRSHPDWVNSYGEYLWMDPGIDAARGHTLEVVADVVRRYDVDGVHIDDYFYPYPIQRDGQPLEFPDDPSWTAYREGGGALDRDDWRRENISRLVRAMYETTHATKPGVLFGVSPFGIPRPGRPPGVVGFDQYASLYADTERWLRQGWCDYWTPQLYWKIEAKGQPFRPLLNHWISQNAKGRHLWPGLSSSRVGDPPNGYDPEEILGQIAIIRESKGAEGIVLFSEKSLRANRRGFADRLKAGPYREPALVPPTPWLDTQAPSSPGIELVLEDKAPKLRVSPGSGEPPFLWAVWMREGDEWTFATYPASTAEIPVPDDEAARDVRISAVDRLGNASEAARVRIQP